MAHTCSCCTGSGWKRRCKITNFLLRKEKAQHALAITPCNAGAEHVVGVAHDQGASQLVVVYIDKNSLCCRRHHGSLCTQEAPWGGVYKCLRWHPLHAVLPAMREGRSQEPASGTSGVQRVGSVAPTCRSACSCKTAGLGWMPSGTPMTPQQCTMPGMAWSSNGSDTSDAVKPQTWWIRRSSTMRSSASLVLAILFSRAGRCL